MRHCLCFSAGNSEAESDESKAQLYSFFGEHTGAKDSDWVLASRHELC